VSRPRLALAALALAFFAVEGPLAAPGTAPPPNISSAGEPLGIRLERIIATRGDLGRGRWLRRLTGRPDLPLFRRPFGVAWDGEALVVTDPGRSEVLRIDERGRTRSSAPDLFESPIGVASCTSGLVVSDSLRGRVALLDRELRLLRWVAQDLERPTGVACAGERLFLVETGRHRVLALDPAGRPVEEARADAAGDDERFVPSREGDGLRSVLDADGLVRLLGRRGEAEGEFNFPTVIAADSSTLWVGDTLNFRIQGFDPSSGELLAVLGRLGDAPGEMPRLKGIAVDAAGRLWISDAYLEQIAIYSVDGVFLTALGSRGGGPGRFSFPAGLSAHPDGRVAVVDSLNRRVQVFRVLDDPM
jgi:sugar lactone lactonase YvrE